MNRLSFKNITVQDSQLNISPEKTITGSFVNTTDVNSPTKVFDSKEVDHLGSIRNSVKSFNDQVNKLEQLQESESDQEIHCFERHDSDLDTIKSETANIFEHVAENKKNRLPTIVSNAMSKNL